jgi:hypothetical protein
MHVPASVGLLRGYEGAIKGLLGGRSLCQHARAASKAIKALLRAIKALLSLIRIKADVDEVDRFVSMHVPASKRY